jgi:hypothetical protein
MTLLHNESKNYSLDFFLNSDGVGAESDMCMHLFFLINFSTKNRHLKSCYANYVCGIVVILIVILVYITGF